jgi:hypothetical protein
MAFGQVTRSSRRTTLTLAEGSRREAFYRATLFPDVRGAAAAGDTGPSPCGPRPERARSGGASRTIRARRSPCLTTSPAPDSGCAIRSSCTRRAGAPRAPRFVIPACRSSSSPTRTAHVFQGSPLRTWRSAINCSSFSDRPADHVWLSGTGSSGSGCHACGRAGGPVSSSCNRPRGWPGTAKAFGSTGAGSPGPPRSAARDSKPSCAT